MVIESKLQELLDKEINLAQSHVERGSKSHVYIRNLLANRRDTDNTFPWLVDGDFLSGSYARGTKLHPLDDIDVMIILDGTGLFPIGLENTHYVRGNAEGKNSPVHNYLGSDNLLNSYSVLDAFQKTLKLSHTDSVIKKNGQSINVKLNSYNLGIDVVPCFHIKPIDTSQQDFYYIPKGNRDPGWLKTNPKIDATISTQLHDRHNKKLKSIIKLLKYWNRTKNNNRIRSYHLETVAWYVFYSHASSVTSITEGIRYFFNNAGAYFVNQIQEATGFGGYVDTYMTPADRQLSITTLNNAKNALQSQGILSSVNNWRVVFGDRLGN